MPFFSGPTISPGFTYIFVNLKRSPYPGITLFCLFSLDFQTKGRKKIKLAIRKTFFDSFVFLIANSTFFSDFQMKSWKKKIKLAIRKTKVSKNFSIFFSIFLLKSWKKVESAIKKIIESKNYSILLYS